RAAELRTLSEALACGVLVRDPGGRIVHANTAAEEMFGISFEEMLGSTSASMWRAIHEDGTEIAAAERPAALALRGRRQIRRFTEGVIRPDGAVRWLQVDSVPVIDAHGEPTQVVS